MSVAHERDINWGNDVFTLPNNTDVSGTPIKVVFTENVMRQGGAYEIWHEKELRGAPVENGLGLYQAKKRAKKLQEKHGSPILAEVEVI